MTMNIQQYIPILSIHPEQARNPGDCPDKVNCIDLNISYDEGSQNWRTGQRSPRGYYLNATPVERNEQRRFVSALLGSRVKTCLLEAARRSDKQLEIATKIAESKAAALLDWCRKEYGIVCEIPEVIFPDAKKRDVPKTSKKPKPVPKSAPADPKPIRSMKLLTAEIIRKLEKHPFGSQESISDDAKVLVKFFGGSAYTFLVTEGEKLENGDWLLFGKSTHGYDWEWCYTLLSEIESMKFPPFGLGAERDMYLKPNIKVCEAIA